MDPRNRNPTATGAPRVVDSSETRGRSQNAERQRGYDATPVADVRLVKRSRRSAGFDVGTWNVRSMYATGETEVVRREAERQHLAILGVSEVRWPQANDFETNGWRVITSGREPNNSAGVAMFINPKWKTAVMGHAVWSPRLITLRLAARGRPISIAQVYMPTAQAMDEEVDLIYEQLDQWLGRVRSNDRVLIMGDFNARVGMNPEHPSAGKFGYGQMNDRGETLLSWLAAHNLVILNGWFRHRTKQRITWFANDGRTRACIDYVITRRRDLREIVDARSTASIGSSDHCMVLAKTKLTYVRDTATTKPKIEWSKLKQKSVKETFRNRIEVCNSVRNEESLSRICEDIVQIAKDTCSATNKRMNQWFTADCETVITERRRVVAEYGHGSKEHREANKAVRRQLRKAKADWLEAKVKEAETAERFGDSKKIYQLVREISGKAQHKPPATLKDSHGRILLETKDVAEEWRTYCKSLFAARDGGTTQSPLLAERMPEVLQEEIDTAIAKLKQGKAPGPDHVPAEAWQAAGEETRRAIKREIDNIWQTGRWPESWTRVTTVPIPKRVGVTRCDEHRTISLVSHASKILLNIIQNRMKNTTEREIGEEQFGFCTGKGTEDAILNVRMILEKCYAHQRPLCVAFVDFAKAFDTVSHNELWEALRIMGIDPHAIWLLQGLYKESSGAVRVGGTTSRPFHIGRGVRQGCPISPLLFNIVTEIITRRLEERLSPTGRNLDNDCTDGYPTQPYGIWIGGHLIWNIKYADDFVVFAESAQKLSHILTELQRCSMEFGLHLNKGKTKVLLLNTHGVVSVNGESLEQVQHFKYLGSLVNQQTDSTQDIKARIATGKTAMLQLRKLWKSSISLSLKRKLVRSLVWSIVLYGSSSWTLKKSDEQRLVAMDNWCWRRMLRISWIQRRTNEWVKQKAGVAKDKSPDLLQRARQRKLRKYGHLMRAPSNITTNIIEGDAGKRRKRGQKTSWLDNVVVWTGMRSKIKAKQAATDRKTWSKLVEGSANA